MSFFFSYILNFAPILIGVVIFYLIKSVNISSRKVRIYHNPRKTGGGVGAEVYDEAGHASRKEIFEQFVRDRLVMDGLLRKGKANYALAGFSLLGILDLKAGEALESYGLGCKAGSISLFLSEPEEFTSRIFSFSRTSGILVGYMASYKLDVAFVVS